MKSIKRCSKLFILIISVIIVISGCNTAIELSEDKVNVVTTVYPIYDFARYIGGEHVHVINLIPTGVDAHDWSPKSQDMSYMSNSQLFLYNGAGLEGWVDDFLAGMDPDAELLSFEVSQGIPLIFTQDPHDQGNEHADDHSEESHHHDVDPHTWLSPKSAMIMARNIKDALIQVDPSHQEDYEHNYEQFIAELSQLDTAYEEALLSEQLSMRQFVVSHQSFGYLARDYGLEQIAILGLAPDTEPTAGDLHRISRQIRDLGISIIFFEELVSDRLVKTLARDLQVETKVLYSLEGLTVEQIEAGENYISLMYKNLQNLLEALQS